MKLIFKERMFSWFDKYDIYDEDGNTVYTVEGRLSFGHKLHIMNDNYEHIGTVKEVCLSFLPTFELYEDGSYLGKVKKQITMFKPAYEMDFKNWKAKGDFFEWDYTINDEYGETVAIVSKKLFSFTDTYVIDVVNDEDALYALMFTLAVDAEKCSRD